MKRKYLKWSIILCLLLPTCIGIYTDMSHLNEDELGWINCYAVGDTVLFKSNRNRYDTLIVLDKRISNSLNPFYYYTFDYSPGPDYNARASFEFKILNYPDSIKGYIQIEKLSQNDEIKWKLQLGNRFSNSWDFEYGKDFRKIYTGENPLKPCTIKYFNDTISACIVQNDSTSYIPSPESYPNLWNWGDKGIEKFIISKDYGLLYYKFYSGEEFYRVME